ncbi:MAG: hypothetical protein QM779_04145 [Propionicimonas sp.]|uniref:hypothetical protein n=1 Tax=Propionicimonas sp. TaxID=1955623 RepID=UPI003D0E99FA
MLSAVNGWPWRRRRVERGSAAQPTPLSSDADAWVTFVDLRAAIDKLLDAAESQFGPRIQFPEDFYWNVPFTEATEVEGQPELDLGSVVDDADSVREFLAQDPSEDVSIWHEADHIAGVLRAIARRDLSSTT